MNSCRSKPAGVGDASRRGRRPPSAPACPRRSPAACRSGVAVVALGLAFLVAGPQARAQYFLGAAGGTSENIEGFTVIGKAFVAARPNAAEVDLEVSAASEVTADAIVKYRDAKRRLQDAFASMKLADVAVEERGLLVDQKGAMINPYYFGGYPQNTRTKTEVQLTRRLVVKASNIRKQEEDAVLQLVGKLLDVAQDAGAKVGKQIDPNMYYYYGRYPQNMGLVRFVLDDLDKLQEEAYEKAIADARARAARLARLSGVALGPIVAVRELVIPGEGGPGNFSGNFPTGDDEVPRKRLETARFQEIPVRVELLVRFEIRPLGDDKERAQKR